MNIQAKTARREKIKAQVWYLDRQAYRDVPKWRNNRKTLFRSPPWVAW